jgi:hypothetical protein
METTTKMNYIGNDIYIKRHFIHDATYKIFKKSSFSLHNKEIFEF